MAALIPSASATGSGTMTLAGPSTNSNQTITIPDATGTMMVSGNMPAFLSYRNGSAQSVTTTTFTKIAFNAEEFDTASAFDSTTNYRFTPQVAGYYQLNATVTSTYATLKRLLFQFWKNGSVVNGGSDLDKASADASSFNTSSASTLLYMNGTTDYVEIYVYLNGTTSGSTLGVANGINATSFSGYLARAA